ncbi:hypothetical protein KSX_43750 [Ktedonospora formicarum]|uniref:Uncharacterized protein n=2 Tax=Ktedonospora formicarum TaxID=2778364 RepID=A0A8J3MRL8_9CHLR|nr:hypothetical protein KSX_43750 [Ktedonospora formicarum]
MPPQYGPQPGVNVTVVNNTQRSNTPLVVEIILSIFGIFGVGWLTAGETTVGIVLLLCSFFVYWPMLVVIGIFSIGVCDFPLIIAAIVVNAILLNNKLKAKAIAYVTMIQSR